MNSCKIYCQAVGHAIRQLDKFSLRGPEGGQDKTDWDEARRRLFQILDRNGYQLATKQIKRKTK